MKKSIIIIPIVIAAAVIFICLGMGSDKSGDEPRDSVSRIEIEETLNPEEGPSLISELVERGAEDDIAPESAVISPQTEGADLTADIIAKDMESDGMGSDGEADIDDVLGEEDVDISYGSVMGDVPATASLSPITISPVEWNQDWLYGDKSRIHTGKAVLYKVSDTARTVAINAGHGTKGGSSVKTLCHPDGTPKVTGGSTAGGSISAIAVSAGTTMLDGTPEATVTLKLAMKLKEKLVARGYNVLMLRDEIDVQLDNVARTVMANNNADIHISIHYDSTEKSKGFFYIGVPEVKAYRNMEPVKSSWPGHEKLGQSILAGVKSAGLKVHGSGNMPLDLTQTSYSTIPSVDLEVGDRASDYSDGTQNGIADAIVDGIGRFFAS